MGETFEHYAAWCRASGAEPLSRRDFMRALREEGQHRGWSIAGGVIHGMGFAA
jgi:hypothetical protein